jgi:hypothetical protein
MITLKLTDPFPKIEKDIKKGLIIELNSLLRKNKDKATKKIGTSVQYWVSIQPEMQSLKNSSVPYSLNSVFGINTDPDSIVQTISAAVANSIKVEYTSINKDFKGGIIIYIQPSDFQNLIGLSTGHVVTEGGSDLHWLNWLLTAGDSVVVAGYQYDPTGGGRSGVGSMVPGGSFRVPPQFSGSVSDNFVTRALGDKQQEIQKIISQEVFK